MEKTRCTYFIKMPTNEKTEVKNLLNRKWQIINEEVAYKNTINCTNAVGIRG
jgi:hypothetical protein